MSTSPAPTTPAADALAVTLSHAIAPAAPDGWRRMCFTAEGHLDLSWLLVSITATLGIGGSICEFSGRHLPPWWYAWLAAFQISVLIAAVPIAKARILANSRAIAAAERALGEAAQFRPHEWAEGDPDEGLA